MLRAIFFDLDGTLCYPRVPFSSVFRAACAALFARNLTIAEDALQEAWGEAVEQPGPSTTSACLLDALRRCGAFDVDVGLVARCADELNARWARTQGHAQGAVGLLDVLGERFPLGLITNGPSDAQREVATMLALAPRFGWLTVSGDAEVGVRKPGREIFARTLAQAGCAPKAALYVGDSPRNDVFGAASAGMRTCWVSADARAFPEGLPRPDLVIGELMELPSRLGELDW